GLLRARLLDVGLAERAGQRAVGGAALEAPGGGQGLERAHPRLVALGGAAVAGGEGGPVAIERAGLLRRGGRAPGEGVEVLARRLRPLLEGRGAARPGRRGRIFARDSGLAPAQTQLVVALRLRLGPPVVDSAQHAARGAAHDGALRRLGAGGGGWCRGTAARCGPAAGASCGGGI